MATKVFHKTLKADNYTLDEVKYLMSEIDWETEPFLVFSQHKLFDSEYKGEIGNVKVYYSKLHRIYTFHQEAAPLYEENEAFLIFIGGERCQEQEWTLRDNPFQEWDGIMELVEGITAKGWEVTFSEQSGHWCEIGKEGEKPLLQEPGETLVQAVRRACFKFIKWHLDPNT